jgi:neutral amino acid transport system permease protein
VRSPLRVLIGLVLAMLCLAAPAYAQEQAEGGAERRSEAVQGFLRHDGEPIEDAEVVVRDAEGEVVGVGESDEEGRFFVELPGPGDYEVTLLEESLPEGVGLRDPERATLEVSIRSGQQRTLIFALGERQSAAIVWLPRIAQQTLHGLKFGLIIAMTAVGLSLIFGTTGLVNFAHGELVTFGAIAAWFLNAAGPRIPLVAAGALAVAAGALLGGVLERGLWHPLRHRGTGLIQMLVISIGLALLIRHILLILFGGRSRNYLDYTIQREIDFGPVSVTPRDLVVMGLSLAVLIGIGLLLERTRIGKAMRAVADNRDLAESSGIDVQRVILFVWVFGGALAALGGVFLGTIETVNYLMGFQLLLLMFAGVILGGLGTAYGALIGSIVVGLVTEVSTVWLSTELKYVWALLILALVLLFRPQGILGVRERIG